VAAGGRCGGFIHRTSLFGLVATTESTVVQEAGPWKYYYISLFMEEQFIQWLRYMLGNRRVRVQFFAGSRVFLSFWKHPGWLGLSQRAIKWVLAALSLGVKQVGHETELSPASSAKMKNTWSSASTPPYSFMGRCLLKYRDNLEEEQFMWAVCKGTTWIAIYKSLNHSFQFMYCHGCTYFLISSQ
jgi:hypothetical protein